MLRTFCSNPGLGGFGNESTFHGTNDAKAVVTPDAFCQIIKELVDNAVDACTTGLEIPKNPSDCRIKPCNKHTESNVTTSRRVRVTIERFVDRNNSTYKNDGEDERELLKVTISDNGCGMKDIQACVGAFHSNKGDFESPSETSTKSNADDTATNAKQTAGNADNTATNAKQTAGRYGIGLTLCLLHAQRLVSDSCAYIQSATSTAKEWTVVTAVVDTASDTVRCFPRKGIPKTSPSESGTAISVLIPGGPTSTLAWPRLAEYFARFKLSLNMTCSLEVLAPTLSRVPLWVHPTESPSSRPTSDEPTKKKKISSIVDKDEIDENVDLTNINPWIGSSSHREREDLSPLYDYSCDTTTKQKENMPSHSRFMTWKATESFLGRSIDVANVAHATVPIRIEGVNIRSARGKKRQALTGPRLTVDVIVHGVTNVGEECVTNDDCFDSGGNDADNANEIENNVTEYGLTNSKSASMVLIRMVNKVPLLDSAEAVACGLVHGLASKKRIWNSFGLNVSMNVDSSNPSAIPTFDVRDSDQVNPYFHQGAHNLLEYDNESETDDDDGLHLIGTKRKRRIRHRCLLPASERLGSILVIVHIDAEPIELPLPTLCKGRLPIGNKSIDDALEVGLTQCLKQLQKTNPNLLLTTAELRKAECDARYVPAVSLALATILANSKILADKYTLERIHMWKESAEMRSHMLSSNVSTSCSNSGVIRNVQTLSSSIERRLRLILTKSTTIASTTHVPVTSSNVDEKENDKNLLASSSSPDCHTLQLCNDGDKLLHVDDEDNIDNQFVDWM